MIREPEKSPAEPKPAMARPTMKAVEFRARAQIREPTSKIRRLRRKTHLILEMLYRRPKKSWKAESVSR